MNRLYLWYQYRCTEYPSPFTIPNNQNRSWRRNYIPWAGQLVVYILMDFHRALIKPKDFIGKFQTSIHKALSTYSQDLILNQEETGIFYKDQKIASFGLKLTKKGSYHGAAINRNMNLDAWKEIVICGNPDHQATDLFSLGVNVDRDKLANEMMRSIRLEFGEDI